MRSKVLLLSLLALSASGCALIPEPETVYVEKIKVVSTPVIHPEPPAPIAMLKVEFDVISRLDLYSYVDKFALENNLLPDQSQQLKEMLGQLVFREAEAWFALDERNYTNLAQNMQEIIRYMTQQRNIAEYYRNAYPLPTGDVAVEQQ